MTPLVKIAIAAGVLGGLYYVGEHIPSKRRAKKRRAQVPAPPMAPPEPVPEPTGPGKPTAPSPPSAPGPMPGVPSYAGTGWTGWPHKDLFPNEGSLVLAMIDLGYRMGETFLDATSVQSITAFQRDYNRVRAAALLDELVIAEGPQRLVVDGKLGSNTIRSLYDAIWANEHTPWRDLVNRAIDVRPDDDWPNLELLGYIVGAGGAVYAFQRDFNRVNVYLYERGYEPLLAMTLMEDNALGPNTREAIAAALDAQIRFQTQWQQLVLESRGAA